MRKRPTKTIRALCLALPILLVAVPLAPTLLSTPPLKWVAERLLLSDSSLTVRASAIGLSWLGPTDLEGLIVSPRDSASEPLLEASRARLFIGLIGLLRGDAVTECEVAGVCLNLRQGGVRDGALEEHSARWKSVSLTNGSVRIRTP
ncbi:MAG: hypothetical protein V2A76_05960, partial [Planctomycetota bacterium]